jgi:hypothetical protein
MKTDYDPERMVSEYESSSDPSVLQPKHKELHRLYYTSQPVNSHLHKLISSTEMGHYAGGLHKDINSLFYDPHHEPAFENEEEYVHGAHGFLGHMMGPDKTLRPLDEPLTTYHGFYHGGPHGEKIIGSRVGQEFYLHGLTSTSLSRRTAQEFASTDRQEDGGIKHVMVIHHPKGSDAGVYIGGLHTGEYEHLLRPGVGLKRIGKAVPCDGFYNRNIRVMLHPFEVTGHS